MAHSNTLSGLLSSNPKLAKLAKQHVGLAEIAAMLIELRQQLGLSQKEFARRAGVSKTMISELENAANDGVTLRTLAKIAKGGALKLNLSFEAALCEEQVGAVEACLNLSRPRAYVVSEKPITALVGFTQHGHQDGLAA
jgi:transcriptional regulator with XRE-family HTH domain